MIGLRTGLMAISLIAAFGGGWKVAAWRADAAMAQQQQRAAQAQTAAVQRAIEQADRLAQQDTALIDRTERARTADSSTFEKIKTEIRYVKVPTDHPDQCPVPAGINRLWQSATDRANIARTPQSATRQLHDALPIHRATQISHQLSALGESRNRIAHTGDGRLCRVCPKAAMPESVDQTRSETP